MFQTLEAILCFDIEKELTFLVSVLENKGDKELITEKTCHKAIQLGFRLILFTEPKAKKAVYLLHIGWKLLDGVKEHVEIARALIHPNIVRDLIHNTVVVQCAWTETLKVVRWVVKVLAPDSIQKMAVKQDEIANGAIVRADLALLAQHIQMLCDQPNYFQSSADLIKWCRHIVSYLARVQTPRGPNKQAVFHQQVHQVEELFQRLLSTRDHDKREQFIYAFLKELYAVISKPGCEPCPAACVVLAVVRPDVISAEVSSLIGGAAGSSSKAQSPDMDTDPRLHCALATLCRWLCVWHYTPLLSNWVLAFMKALQESEKYNILVDVSLEVIADLFEGLLTASTRHNVSAVVLHILASMRNSIEPFHKIAGSIPNILEALASDASPAGRPLLQNLVEALSALVVEHKPEMDKYPEIMSRLDAHIKSNHCSLMNVPVWVYSQQTDTPLERAKVGLHNLGSTCYMNSILQALLMTKPFSRSVILNCGNFSLVTKLGTLFAQMTFSMRPYIIPAEFFNTTRPTHFVRNTQHDSSEYLSFLLDSLHEQECLYMCYGGAHNKPSCSSTVSQATKEIDDDQVVSSTSQGIGDALTDADIAGIIVPTVPVSLTLPTAGCSSYQTYHEKPETETVSGSNKRTDEAEGTCTVKKRKRSSGTVHEAPKIERSPVKTVVMETFSGSSTTNVECSNCNKVSAKKDTFRDLQLCFPLTNKQRNDEVYSVQQLLDFYCSDEMMSGENKYACGNCNSLQDARKSMIIDRAPQNLIIVLKHFWFDGKHQYRAKLLHRVEHNRTISLLEGDTMVKFDLYAAVVHSGNSLDSGHYYTIARDGQHWYKFDDTRVTVCRESELHSLPSPNTPYVLFYKREGFSTPCASPARPIETVSEADAYGEAEEPSAASSDSEEFLPFSSLPVDLREKITRDNLQYRSQYTRTRTSRSMMKNPRTPRDSDDDSPSPCGGSNDIKTNFNRYIY